MSSLSSVSEALDLAFDLASRPGFDSLFDPHPETQLIEAYHDPVGYPTQGYGRLLSRVKWEDLSKYPGITPAEAKDNLVADLNRAARSTHSLITAPLKAHQWAALYDFTFNCGGGNLQVSSLRARVNRGDAAAAPEELPKWCHAGPVKLAGLVRRRAAEVRMWEEGV